MTKILELIIELGNEGDKLEPSRRELFQDLVDKFQAEVRQLLTPEEEPADEDTPDGPPVSESDLSAIMENGEWHKVFDKGEY